MRKRSIQVMLHLSSKEYDSLSKKVKRSGLSREAYIRQLINGYMSKELPPPDYHGMMRELNDIGNHMKQIAARANATGFFLAEEYDGYMQEFRSAILSIQAAVTQPEKL